MSNQEKLNINRLNTILNEVQTNISQYNKYYSQYLVEQSNNCKSNNCNKLLTLMDNINSYLMTITLEAQNIVKNLNAIDNNNKNKYDADMVKLDNIYKKVKSEQQIIKKLKNDILNLDTQNKNAIDEKNYASSLVLILSIVSILLLVLSGILVNNNNILNLILTIVIIVILVINIFNVTNV